LSLPLAFNTQLDSIPSGARYLSIAPAQVARWQERLGGKTKPRIGLIWSAGNWGGVFERVRADLIHHIPRV
jgi:hypothetical protein